MDPRLLPKKNKPVTLPEILKRDSPKTISIGNTDESASPSPADPIQIAQGVSGKINTRPRKVIARMKLPISNRDGRNFLVNWTEIKRPKVNAPQNMELI